MLASDTGLTIPAQHVVYVHHLFVDASFRARLLSEVTPPPSPSYTKSEPSAYVGGLLGERKAVALRGTDFSNSHSPTAPVHWLAQPSRVSRGWGIAAGTRGQNPCQTPRRGFAPTSNPFPPASQQPTLLGLARPVFRMHRPTAAGQEERRRGQGSSKAS